MKLAVPSISVGKNWLFNVGLSAILLLFSIAISVPYINSQQAFLGGDINDDFYQLTLQAANTFRQSPLAGLLLISKSLERDYNSLFTLLLIPFVLIFGSSYLVYVLSLAIVYLLPFILIIGTIATQLIPVYPQAVFVSTTLIAAIVTPSWITLFQGYPDISAALIIALSMRVCLRGIDRHLTWLFPDRWQIPVLGVLFGIAILFRRHFAYAVIALVGAICLYTAIVFSLQLRQNVRLAWRNLAWFGLQISLVLTTSLVTLLIFSWKFTQRAFTQDYVTLYASWSRPWQEILSFYSSLYGWSIWLLAIVGLIAGTHTQTLRLPVTILISTFGSISIGLWLFRLRYTETYYALHFLPFILLGLSAFVWTIGLNFRSIKRSLFLALISLLLISNALFGITALGNKLIPAIRPWWAASFPPPVRSDYDQIVQIVDFLRQLAPAQEPVFVVYSSNLPMHLLKAAEATVYGESGRILNFKQGSPTDSDGFYPLSDLLRADYVVVTQPFQGWNEPEQQTVRAVFDMFTQGWEFAQDFEALPQQFRLQKDALVTVYRRIRPTSIDRAVRTLYALQVQVNKPLGKQHDWIPLSSLPDSSVQRNRQNRQTLNLSASLPDSDQNDAAFFLYLGAIPEQAEVMGKVILPKSCSEIGLRISSLNQQGQFLRSTPYLQRARTAPLKMQVNGAGASYLLLEVVRSAPVAPQSEPQAKQTEPCRIRLNATQVTAQE